MELDKILKIMQMVNQTTNSIGQMQQLNNQIAINDQKLDYAAMLKRTEMDNQLNKQTVIKTVASNIAEQDKLIKKHLDEFVYHGATMESIYENIEEDTSSDGMEELFGDENERFEKDFRYLGEVKGTWEEQLNADIAEYNHKNKLLASFDNLRNEIDENTTHMREVGTEENLKTIKDADDIQKYMLENKEIFQQPKLERDVDGNIVYDANGMPKKVLDKDDKVIYEGWNAQGEALLTQIDTKKTGFGFAPKITNNMRKKALATNNHYNIINQNIREVEAMINSQVGMTTGFKNWLKKTGLPNMTKIRGTAKQYEHIGQIQSAKPFFEDFIIKHIEESMDNYGEFWDKDPDWTAWTGGAKNDELRHTIVSKFVDRYIGKEPVFDPNVDPMLATGADIQTYNERPENIIGGRVNLVEGKWNQSLKTDEFDLYSGRFGGREYGEGARYELLYSVAELWQSMDYVDPLTEQYINPIYRIRTVK